jgi:hypothetical protein
MRDDLAVDRALEDRARVHELGAERSRVREVAVVDEAEVALAVAREDGLRVHETGAAGGGVAGVPERGAPRQRAEQRVVDALGDLTSHLLDARDALIVDRAQPGGFLPAVLERVEAERRDLRRAIDA